MNAPLLLRADASPEIGSGHVMRCLALAQAWQRAGGRCVFASAEITPSLAQRLRDESVETVSLAVARGSADDAVRTAELARSLGAAWIVADGYCFDADWQQRVHTPGVRLLIADDYGQAEYYHADFILNQNTADDKGLYRRREPTTRLLLGPRFALLRREFSVALALSRVIPPVARKILVTLGGSDPDNVTATVIAAIAQMADVEIAVVLGGSNPNLDTVRQVIARHNREIRLVVDAANMPELMAWADVAVSAAGSTAWELAYSGLPALLIVVADNQTGIAEALDCAGISLNLGRPAALTAERITHELRSLLADGARRQTMSREGRRLVDGNGAARVATHLLAAQIGLRRAGPDDCALLWEWVNDAAVRSSAFHPTPIPWDDHRRWFQAKLAGPGCVIFVCSGADGQPAGQVRFEWGEDLEAEIDVSVACRQRHTGLGPALIRRAVDELFTATPVTAVRARIKAANSASIRAFEKAGFNRRERTTGDNSGVVHMVISRLTEHLSSDSRPAVISSPAAPVAMLDADFASLLASNRS